jgi:hypothetical protein
MGLAGAAIGAAVIGAGAMAASSSAASSAQTSASNRAINSQLGMFNTTQANLSPFQAAGAGATNILSQLLGFKPQVNGGVQYGQMTDDQKEQALTALRQQYGGDEAKAEAAFGARGAMGGQGFGDLVPGLSGGALPLPNGLTAGMLTQTFQPTQAQLEATPGYQFNLTQGEKAVTNSAASRGLGVSGAALRGAADYASGLADTTYQNQFNNFQTQQNNLYNRLSGLADLGESAGAGVGTAATQTGSGIAGSNIGIGNAQAAAAMASGNSVASGANNVSNTLLLQALLKGNGGASGGAGIFAGGAAGNLT